MCGVRRRRGSSGNPATAGRDRHVEREAREMIARKISSAAVDRRPRRARRIRNDPRRIDAICRRADHPPRSEVNGTCSRDDVAVPQQLPRGSAISARPRKVVGFDPHAERTRRAGDAAPTCPSPTMPSVKCASSCGRAQSTVPTTSDELAVEAESSRQRDHEPDHELRHGVRVFSGRLTMRSALARRIRVVLSVPPCPARSFRCGARSRTRAADAVERPRDRIRMPDIAARSSSVPHRMIGHLEPAIARRALVDVRSTSAAISIFFLMRAG